MFGEPMFTKRLFFHRRPKFRKKDGKLEGYTMTKTVFLMRHGAQEETTNPVGGLWDTRAPLSEKGASAVTQMAEICLRDAEMTYYGSSPLLRAWQTAHMVRRALRGSAECEVDKVDNLGPGDLNHWNWLGDLTQIIPDPTPRELLAHNPWFIQSCGTRVEACIRVALGKIRNGESALLVSHNPLIDAGVALATGKWPANLNCAKGGIYRLDYANGESIPEMTYLVPVA